MTLQIQFQASKYGSITQIEMSEGLPPFSLITGKNGAGKSQLFAGIASGEIPVTLDGATVLADEICLLKQDSIPKSKREPANLFSNEIELIWEVLRSHRAKLHQQLASEVRKIDRKLYEFDVQFLSSEEQFYHYLVSHGETPETDEWKSVAEKHISDLAQQSDDILIRSVQNAPKPLPKVKKQTPQPLTAEYKLKQHLDSIGVGARQLVAALPKEFDILFGSKDEFYSAWSPYSVGNAFLNETISAWFQRYAEACSKFTLGRLNERMNSESDLSVKEFKAEYGVQPWNIVNDVFEQAGIPFEIDHPDFANPSNYAAQLTHRVTGEPVSLDVLSSGEKAILFMIPKLSVANNSLVHLPKLILFDEMDSMLHPSLTKLFIQTLGVVKRHSGSYVSLITHSPSTVAIVSQEHPNAVFVVEPDDSNPPVHTVKRTSAELAVHTLTSGLVSVTRGSQIVITEASTDEIVYRDLYSTLIYQKEIPTTPNLVFLRASEKKPDGEKETSRQGHDGSGGGKDQVRQWVEKLTEIKLPNFRGLIDFDSGNQAHGPIHVLDRYSIENLLLDPVLIFARILQKQLHLEIFDQDVLPSILLTDFNLTTLEVLTDEEIQTIADVVRDKIRVEESWKEAKLEELVLIEYRNGKSVRVPKWVLYARGKDVLANVRAAFDHPRKGDRLFSNLQELGQLLSKNVPGFIPRSFVEIVRRLISPE